MSEEPENRRREVDDTLEDAFGVNLRALTTLRDVLFRTDDVFRAFAAGDRETYTPTIRLFVGLIALQVFVSYLWGGYAGLLLSQWQQQPNVVAQMEQLFGGPVEVITEHYGNAATFLHAVVVGGFTALSAFLVGSFNRSLGWVARVNITFTVLSAGTVFGLILLVASALTNHMALIGFAPVAVFLSYWFFFVRGAPGVLAETRTGTILKGGLFAAVTMIYVIIGGFVMGLIGMAYAYVRMNGG